MQKSYGRLFLCDARRRYTAAKVKEEQTLEEKKDPAEEELEFQQVDNDDKHTEIDAVLQEWLSKPIEETYTDKTLEAALKKVSASSFKQRLVDANRASQLVSMPYRLESVAPHYQSGRRVELVQIGLQETD
jgi:hypothetical protein